MKKIVLATSLGLVMLSGHAIADGDDKAKELMNSLCTACHVTSGKGKIAPPMFAVKKHVKKAYSSKEDFVQRIVDWVEEPEEAIALMPGAIKKFGLMPKLPYKTEDVEKIAEYLFDEDLKSPKWYKKHYEEKHGKDE